METRKYPETKKKLGRLFKKTNYIAKRKIYGNFMH